MADNAEHCKQDETPSGWSSLGAPGEAVRVAQVFSGSPTTVSNVLTGHHRGGIGITVDTVAAFGSKGQT